MRLHRHMEEGLSVITDGADFDCPPERECWFEGPPEHIGRQVRKEGGAVFVFASDCYHGPEEDSK